MKRGEDLMREWDTARRAIATGNTSSWPRDWFESVIDCRDERIAELESLLREIDAKIVFETAVADGTGNDLQERVEAALGIKKTE